MLNFEHSKAVDVVTDTRAALASCDTAIRSVASLTLSFLDATGGSNMPAQHCQRALQAMHDSTGQMLNGRATMVEVVALLTAFQRGSNLAETDFGCPGPVPLDVPPAEARGVARPAAGSTSAPTPARLRQVAA